MIEIPSMLRRANSRNSDILAQKVSKLTAKFADLWQTTGPGISPIGRIYDQSEQIENESTLREVLRGKNREPKSREEARIQSVRLKTWIRDLLLRSLDSNRRVGVSGLLDTFFDAGEGFALRAREFDGELGSAGIFQALRNVWIVNSLQAGFGLPVHVNPSCFAYSLLYTYTDNFLDDCRVPDDDKSSFGSEFGRRLSGIDTRTDWAILLRVGRLVHVIEEEFPRSTFPEVYDSLLAIHRAQLNSLRQHTDNSSDILRLSVEKGGTSVLADGYITKGELTSLEQEFSFGYGVFLQFIDDLQDVVEDIDCGSQTLFTLAARDGKLDDITTRFVAFMNRILNLLPVITKARLGGLSDLIVQSCCGLALETVALHPALFSKEFVRQYEYYSPLRFEAIRCFHEEFQTPESSIFVKQFESCQREVA